MTNGILAYLVALLVPGALLLVVLKATGTLEKFRRMHFVKKIATFVVMWCLSLYAYDKPEPPKFHQLLTINGPTVESATFKDLSNRFVYWLKTLGRNTVNTALLRLNEPMNAIIEEGVADVLAYTDTIYSNDVDRTYINIEVPFGVPSAVPANIAATVLHEEWVVVDGKKYKDAFVWFNRPLVTNINLYANIWLNDGEFIPLNVVTNFWPETVVYDGVETVKYRFEVPNIDKKIVLRKQVKFGSKSGYTFSVKDVVLEKDNEFWYTFSGILELNVGHTNLLVVTINKGIVKRAFYNGVEIVNAPRLMAAEFEPGGDSATGTAEL